MEHSRRSAAARQIGQAREDSGENNTYPWHAIPVALEEESGCLSVLSKTEEISRGLVEEGISSRCGTGQNHRVDNVVENWNVCIGDGDNPWRRACVSVTSQIRVVVWAGDANSKGAETVEEQDSPEYTANSFRNVSARVSGFAGGDSNGFDSTVAECSVDERGEEREEPTSAPARDRRRHSSRAVPVPEAKSIMSGTTPKHNAETKDEQAEKRDDLDTRKDEFCFPIDGHCENVEANDQDDEDGDPWGRIDVWCPVCDERGSS